MSKLFWAGAVVCLAAAFSAAQDPTKIEPKHYKLDFENDKVQVVAVHYGPHEKGETHEHILNRVVLYLNDQPNAKADDVRVAGAATHAEENASAQPADRIAVELK